MIIDKDTKVEDVIKLYDKKLTLEETKELSNFIDYCKNSKHKFYVGVENNKLYYRVWKE